MGSFCRKQLVRENPGSGVTAPKVVKSTFFQSRISRQQAEQIEICFDFWKVRELLFQKRYNQIFDISTPSPLKSAPKIGSDSGPKKLFAIFLECMSLDFSGFAHAVRD